MLFKSDEIIELRLHIKLSLYKCVPLTVWRQLAATSTAQNMASMSRCYHQCPRLLFLHCQL